MSGHHSHTLAGNVGRASASRWPGKAAFPTIKMKLLAWSIAGPQSGKFNIVQPSKVTEEFQSYSSGWGMSPAVRLEASRLGERLMASQQATAPKSGSDWCFATGSCRRKNCTSWFRWIERLRFCMCQMIFLYGFLVVCHSFPFTWNQRTGTMWSWESALFRMRASLVHCQATMASQIVIDEMEAATSSTTVESSANQWQRISRFDKLIELIEDVSDDSDVYIIYIYIYILCTVLENQRWSYFTRISAYLVSAASFSRYQAKLQQAAAWQKMSMDRSRCHGQGEQGHQATLLHGQWLTLINH